MSRVLVCSQIPAEDGGVSGNSATPKHPLFREGYELWRQGLENYDKYEKDGFVSQRKEQGAGDERAL
jgi:hypothetical protein